MFNLIFCVLEQLQKYRTPYFTNIRDAGMQPISPTLYALYGRAS
jgi:hypothetical protein